MNEVTLEDGQKVQTTLPPEDVADLQAKPAPAAEPAKPEPAEPAPVEPKTEEPKAEPAKEPEAPKGRKASPIANLLSQRHELESKLEAAERRAQEAEAKLTQPTPPAPAAPQATDDVGELAKKHGITDPSLIKDIIETARKGLPNNNPALPKELQDLLAERQQEKAVQAETEAFNTRVDKLSTVFKDEPIGVNKDKLMQLAYSTDKAPDGERYCDKELSELYFGYIKPTIEPGTVSAEPTRRAPAQTQVIDFQEILDRDDPAELEKMDDKTFDQYSKWLRDKQGDVPLK